MPDEPGAAGGTPAVSAGIVTAAVVAFVLAVWNLYLLRRGAGWLAPRMAPLLFLVAVGATVAIVARRASGAVRPEADARLHASLGRFRFLTAPAVITASVVAYLIPVFGGWVVGTRPPLNLAGIVPYGDGTLWFGGAERLLFDGAVDDYGGKRPLNTALLAVRLALTHLDLRMAMVLQGVLLGVACGLLALVVARFLGWAAALVLFAGVFGFLGLYAATTLTEPLGLTFGALAAAALVAALHERNARLFAAGLFLLTVALSVRPGAVAVFVLLPLWYARATRTEPGRLAWPALRLGVVAVVAGLAVNFLASFSTGGNPANLNSNSMYMVYGLAMGSPGWDTVHPGWTRVFNDHPEIAPLDDARRSKAVRTLALRALRDHPARFLTTLARSEGNYLRVAKGQTTAIGNLLLRRTVQVGLLVLGGVALYRRRAQGWRDLLVDVGLFLASVVGLPVVMLWGPLAGLPRWTGAALALSSFVAFVVVGGARRLTPLLSGFLLVATFGVLASVPVIGLDSARVLAATAPVMLLVFAVAAAVLVSQVPNRPPAAAVAVPPVPRWSPVAVGSGLVVAALLGAPLAAALVRKPHVEARTCPDGHPAQALLGATSVRVVGDGEIAGEGVAAMGGTRASSHMEQVALLAIVKVLVRPGTTVAGGIDSQGNDRILFLTGDAGTPASSVLYYCGGRLGDAISGALSVFWPRPVDFAFTVGTPLPAGSRP